MSTSATVPWLVAALLSLACAPASYAQAVHDTGTLQLEDLGNGFIGASLGVGAGMVFGGANGLFEGQFLVGADFEQVSGHAYSGNTPGTDEWVNRSGPDAIGTPFPIPYEEFDQGYGSSYDDANADDPIGLHVTQRSYSCDGSESVVFEFGVTNTSGYELQDIFIGVFADFNVGDFEQNLWGYDDDTESIYLYDATDPDTDHFGMTAVNGIVSGWDYEVGLGAPPTEPQLYTALAVQAGPGVGVLRDYRTVIGTGPYTLGAGATVVGIFAFVAGEDEADFLANAEGVRGEGHSGPSCYVSPANEAPGDVSGLELHGAYPNPSEGRATVSFSLKQPQEVRLAVYDALGREVAVLAEGMQAAGTHAVAWDGTALPAGMYVCRLEAGGHARAMRLVLLR